MLPLCKAAPVGPSVKGQRLPPLHKPPLPYKSVFGVGRGTGTLCPVGPLRMVGSPCGPAACSRATLGMSCDSERDRRPGCGRGWQLCWP